MSFFLKNEDINSFFEARNIYWDIDKQIIKSMLKKTFESLKEHPINKLFKRKTENYESWIIGMQKLKQKILDETGDLKINTVYKFLKN